MTMLKQHKPWLVIGLLSFSLLLFGISGCQTPTNDSSTNGASKSSPTPGTTSQTPKDQLLEASKAAGVNVHTDEIFSISRGGESVIAAPIAGWETIPATELRNGVNFGYAYFATEEPRVPAGYYTLKAFADVRAVGTVQGRVQLIDRGGKVAAELPSQIEVHSMTVPPEAANQRSFVTVARQQQGIWFRCPNGECIVIGVLRPRDLTIAH